MLLRLTIASGKIPSGWYEKNLALRPRDTQILDPTATTVNLKQGTIAVEVFVNIDWWPYVPYTFGIGTSNTPKYDTLVLLCGLYSAAFGVLFHTGTRDARGEEDGRLHVYPHLLQACTAWRSVVLITYLVTVVIMLLYLG